MTSHRSISHNFSKRNCDTCTQLGPKPFVPPAGVKFIAEWKLVPDISASSPASDVSTNDQSFEEIFLERIKGPSDKPPPERRKVDLI